ncbi:MAG: hemolysin family protein [Pseudomonadota bacterium]
MTDIMIIAVLMLVNAFFAMSEMAIVSASRPMLRQRAKQGDWRAQKALELSENPGRFLSTVQVGITLVGIFAGAYGGATLAEPLAQILLTMPQWVAVHAETASVVIVVTAITFVSVVFGELVPKQLAMAHAQTLSCLVAPIMIVLSTIFGPIAGFLERAAALILWLCGVRPNENDGMTEEEVRAVIAEGAENGVLEQTEHEMLQRIIHLGDRTVKSIMTHRMELGIIDVNGTLEDITQIVHERGHSRYPVKDGESDNIIGLISSKDILDAILTRNAINIRDYVIDLPSLPENTPCLKALELFKNTRAHMAMVQDEYGIIQGVITASDILEAIVGVLPSNYDDDEGGRHIIEREDGSWLVDGLTPIQELHLTIGLEQIKTDEQYDTLAGFLLDTFGHLPQASEKVTAHGYEFEVMDMDGRRIDKVLITRHEDEDES